MWEKVIVSESSALCVNVVDLLLNGADSEGDWSSVSDWLAVLVSVTCDDGVGDALSS